MEVKFKLDVDTPKGKVSAIRTVIGMGKIPYLERLEIVERILKEVAKPLESPAPNGSKEVLPQKIHHALDGERFVYPKIDKMGLLQSLPGDHPTFASIFNTPMAVREAILRAYFIESDYSWINTKHRDSQWGIWPHSFMGRENGQFIYEVEVAAALLLGVHKGLFCMRIRRDEDKKKGTVSRHMIFHTKEYADAHPEIPWVAGIPDALRGESLIGKPRPVPVGHQFDFTWEGFYNPNYPNPYL